MLPITGIGEAIAQRAGRRWTEDGLRLEKRRENRSGASVWVPLRDPAPELSSALPWDDSSFAPELSSDLPSDESSLV